MTACVCGAHKTYKAGPKSTLHSDWCDESPRFVRKGATVISAKDAKVFVDGKPLQFYSGTFNFAPVAAAAPKKPDCYGCNAMQGKSVPSVWEIWYPANAWSAAPTTRYFCGTCAPLSSHQNLINNGCKVTRL